jgi:hypothetical protein
MNEIEFRLLREISKKLSILISLELQREEGAGAVQKHVAYLTKFGLTPIEMAEILGTTRGTVAVAKSRVKHRSK